MKCPNCSETLVMAERHGVEIDYCPSCRGVWLDKGELDKIIDRAAENEAKFSPPSPSSQQQAPYYDDRQYKHDPYYKHKKKKGFLGEFFDF